MAIQDLVDNAQPEEQTPESEKVKILLRENAKLRKKLEKKDSGWEIIQSIIEDVYEAPSNLHLLPPAPGSHEHEEVAVVHATDIHYGKETETYNVAVCEQRVVKLAHAVGELTELRRATATIDRCKLLLGGDNIEGDGIFPGQAWETEVDIITQMIKEGPEVVANLIIYLAGVFPALDIHGVPGNHGRQARFGSKRHNADSIFYEIVRSMVRAALSKEDYERITWDLPLDRPGGREWFARFDICPGRGAMLIHGDQIRGQMGLPWYGFYKKICGWRTTPATQGFQYLFSGHFHTQAKIDFNTATVFATGSPECSNAYALENMAAGGNAKQRLAFFNESRGLLADYDVHLGDKRE